MSTPMNFFTEEEKAGSKMRIAQQKKGNRLLILLMVVFAALILILALFLMLFLRKNKEVPVGSESVSVAQMMARVTPAPEPSAAPVATPDSIPRDAWYLTLVNGDHPLSADFTVETEAIDPAGYYLDARAVEDYEAMLEASVAEGLQLKIASSYRTYARQNELYLAKVRELSATLPAEEAERTAATLVAKPGTSEHNLGLALDIVATYNQRMQADYEETPECQWLAAHAWEYGFILRYPKEKQEVTGVTYEPWHYRYVGREQAQRIQESGLCLEEYLAV